MENGHSANTRLALAHRRKDVFAINQGIRSGLVASGSLEGEHLHETDHGPRAFAKDDRILFTRNDKTLGLRNGMLGKVTRVNAQTIRVRLDENDREVSLDTRAYRSLDHGCAVSIHKSQGCTVDRTFVFGSSTMDRHLTYVAMTRHREEARLYRTPKFLSRARNSDQTKHHRSLRFTRHQG